MPPSSITLRTPWFALLAAATATCVWLCPGTFDVLAYDRARILQGEVWRLLTGHWVHFTGSHLFWNLVILLPAGIWLEQHNRPALVRTFVLASLAISLGLLVLSPGIAVYAGISGVASGVIAALAVDRLRARPDIRRWWIAVLALLAVRVAVDAIVGSPLNPDLDARGIGSAPLAHLLGALAGAAAAAWPRHEGAPPRK